MASLKIRRKKKYSRRTHKERRNNTKKRNRRKNKTRKVKRKQKKINFLMRGGTIDVDAKDILEKINTSKNQIIENSKNDIIKDRYYNCNIVEQATGDGNTKPTIRVIDKQPLYRITSSDNMQFLQNEQLMLLENLIDIIHDVIAEGDLSYDALLSIDMIIKCYTALYNYHEWEGWWLLVLGLFEEGKIAPELIIRQIQIQLQLDTYRAEEIVNNIVTVNKNLQDLDVNLNKELWYNIFKLWFDNFKDNKPRTNGASLELIFKNFMYKKIQNKYIINPTYGQSGVQAEILQLWQYANTSDRQINVSPYGGGSILDGVKLWQYILNRGNSFLEHKFKDNYTWVENSIDFPSKQDIDYYKEAVNSDYLLNFDIKHMEYQDILKKEKDMTPEELEQIKTTKELFMYVYKYYLFYAFVYIKSIENDMSSDLTSLQKRDYKERIYGNYQKIFATNLENKLYDFSNSVNFNLHINFTDAGNKISSALAPLYSLMQLRGTIYPEYTSRLPIENVSISNVIDKATSKVGPPVKINMFGDERKPVCRIDGNEYEQALLYDFEVIQSNFKYNNGRMSDLCIKQMKDTNQRYNDYINFLIYFKDIYSCILNDVRFLYKDYINTGYTINRNVKELKAEEVQETEISTKDLIKLKFFQLINYFLYLEYIENQEDAEEPEDEEMVDQGNVGNNEIKNDGEEDEQQKEEENVGEKNIKYESVRMKKLEKLIDKIQKKSGKELSDTELGDNLKNSMSNSYLSPFFSNNKPNSYNLTDHWKEWSNTLEHSKYYLSNEKLQNMMPKRNGDDESDRKKKAINVVRRSPFFRISKTNMSREEIINITGRKHKNNKDKKKSFIEDTIMKTNKTKNYFDKSFNTTNLALKIMNEFFSTNVEHVELKKAIEIYSGWLKSNFTDCSCNEITEFTPAEIGELLSLKGTCVNIKENSQLKYKSNVEENTFDNLNKIRSELRPKILLLENNGKYKIRIETIFIKKGPENQGEQPVPLNTRNYTKQSSFVYNRQNKVLQLKEAQMKNLIIQNFRKCKNIVPEVDNPPPALPLDLNSVFSILQKKKPIFDSIDEDNKHFTQLLKREKNDETVKGLDHVVGFWKKIGKYSLTDIKQKVNKIIKKYPNMFTLLYNCLSFDFETAESFPGVGFTGNRTTGRIGFLDERKVINGETFIQDSINTSIENLESLDDKLKGEQEITFKIIPEQVKDNEDIRYNSDPNAMKINGLNYISFRSNNPSVTGVLTNLREYMVYFLIKTGNLEKKLGNRLLENKEFFNIEARSGKGETKDVQDILNCVMRDFISLNPKNRIDPLTDKILEELKKNRNIMTIREVAKKNKVILSRDKKPKTLDELLRELDSKLEILKMKQLDRLDDDKIQELLLLISEPIKKIHKESNGFTLNNIDAAVLNSRFIVAGIILNHKTQGDEMQLHAVKALKDLFCIDTNNMEVLYHVYSYDGVMGIKALRKGASLLFQSDRGIQISLAGYTDEIAWKRLEKENEPASDFSDKNFLPINVKDPVTKFTIDTPNSINLRIKQWLQNNISIMYKDFLTEQKSDEVTKTQMLINSKYENLSDIYTRAIICVNNITFGVINVFGIEEGKCKEPIVNNKNQIYTKLIEGIYRPITTRIKQKLEGYTDDDGNQVAADEDFNDFKDYIDHILKEENNERLLSVCYDCDEKKIAEIKENLPSLIKSIDYFQTNLSRVIGRGTEIFRFEDRAAKIDFGSYNTPRFGYLDLIREYSLTIIETDDVEEKRKLLKRIKILLKFYLVYITNEADIAKINFTEENDNAVDNSGDDDEEYVLPSPPFGEPIPPGSPGDAGTTSGVDVTSPGTTTALDAVVSPGTTTALDTVVSPQPMARARSIPQIGSQPEQSVSSPLQGHRASVDQGIEYPSVNYIQFLKLRLGKFKALYRYLSSEAFKIDKASNLLEGATAVPKIIRDARETLQYLRTKTSAQNEELAEIYNNKFDITREESINLWKSLAPTEMRLRPRSISRSRLTFSSDEDDSGNTGDGGDGGAEKTTGQEMEIDEKLDSLKRKREETTKTDKTGETDAEIDKDIKRLRGPPDIEVLQRQLTEAQNRVLFLQEKLQEQLQQQQQGESGSSSSSGATAMNLDD